MCLFRDLKTHCGTYNYHTCFQSVIIAFRLLAPTTEKMISAFFCSKMSQMYVARTKHMFLFLTSFPKFEAIATSISFGCDAKGNIGVVPQVGSS